MNAERPWLNKLLFAFFICAIAYPLSMGPSYWLLSHRVISQPFFNAVYYPLKPLTINSGLFQKYLDLWGDPL